ncbi:hypothetical protein MMG85_06505 [Pseudoxanthomonas sp. LH2527]|uniref:hypothetical protein n=1 Tax=Pseudoxanthomonas sp. LH2527 TaxID=2923249 RepID=UPI001F149323|nr:hypothetical protein [Pseudoxanthomonas sp. LH2527]MCH6483215.1 hypothetical protein [Pseudoxanthomonas sp. LH2527]
MPANVRQTCAPRGKAVRWYRMPLILALMVFCGALGFASAGPRTNGLTAAAVETSASLMTDARDGDPPHQARHRELHLKKPRLSTLQVRTRLTSPMCAPPAFPADDFHVVAANGAGSRPFAILDAAHVHRTDPALRLHPGQAPPHAG